MIMKGKQGESIQVNQIGYAADGVKRAVIQGECGSIELVKADTGETVWTGEARAGEQEDPASGSRVSVCDFSAYRETGVYVVRAVGYGSSHPFTIGESPYREVRAALLKSFYYQRCGMALEESYAGEWMHAACHLDEGTVHGSQERRPSAGGWHDAGDYGKYVVAAAKAVADLMLAYELFPNAWAQPLGIPESGNGVPDLLNETAYELRWLFLMQRVDGAVYHKLTTYAFPGLAVMPEEDVAELVFSPVSYTAAGTFAASMAMAARVYRPFNASFADECLAAAERAWSWLCTAEAAGFTNPTDVSTGEYGDAIVVDERYWAAAELYRTTGKAEYETEASELAQQALTNLASGFPLYELGWADVGGYGTLALLFSGEERIGASLYQALYEGLLAEAEKLNARSQRDGYGISLDPQKGYIWGSNMNVMNHAMLLIVATKLSGRADLAQTIASHWDYLLGCNAAGYCYVTGFGGKRVMHPHHRPSVADGVAEPVPGMIAGGPNAGLQDDAAREHLSGRAPACCFVDHEDSYSTNEMTIYWNSPAVFVAAYMDAL